MKKLESNEQYHSNKAIGSTILKKIANSTILHAMNDEFETSDAMALGSAVHCAFLEPEKLASSFITLPEDAPNKPSSRQINAKKPSPETIMAINFWNQFNETAKGKTILTREQLSNTHGMVSSIKEHKIAMGMLSGGEAEYSYYVTCPITGLERKCRPDYLNKDALVDLKTCQDASVDGFARACIKLGYHIQAAYYLDVFNMANGTNLKEFYFVAVESSKPYAVNTFLMGEAEIALGRQQYEKALKQLAEFFKNPANLNAFGYERKINEIVYPAWAFDKLGA